MKPTTYLMKTLLKLACVMGLFVLSLPTSVQAQSTMTVISAEEAANGVAQQQAYYGFGQAYFGQGDINTLLSEPNAASVRFYTAQPEGGSPTVVAASVDAAGSETGLYIRSQGLSGLSIDMGTAQGDVMRGKDNGYTAVALTVSNTDLTQNIMNANGSGIHIKPGLSGNTNTMIATAATTDGTYSQDLGTDNLRGEAPCPNNCGDGFLVDLNNQ